MKSDRTGLKIAVLWLLALWLLSAGLAWAWVRWGRIQILLVGAPAVLVVLWGAGGAVMRLLPNLV